MSRALVVLMTLAPALAVAAPEPLTLAQALQRAQAANPALGAAGARVNALRAAAEGAGRAFWPTIAASSTAERTDNAALAFMARLTAAQLAPEDLDVHRLVSPDATGHLTTALSLELPLDVSGKLRRRRDAAVAAAGSAAEVVDEARLDLRLGVESAYWRAWLETEAQGALGRAVEAAAARRDVVAAGVDAGAALGADLLRARARERQREGERAVHGAARQAALAALAQWMGAKDASFTLSENPPPPADWSATLEGWQARAGAQRPLVRAAEARLRAAMAAARLERASSWPELSGYARAIDDRGTWDGGRRSYAVGIAARWLVLDAARGSRRAESEAAVRAAEQDLTAAKNQVSFDVADAWARSASARERQAAARGGVEEGREALRVMRERRVAGLATLTDELETEAAALSAELEELAATIEVTLADAALRRATGMGEGGQP